VTPSAETVFDHIGRPSRVFVSRYFDFTLRERLETVTNVAEVPCVRGSAVVSPGMVGDLPVLLGWPNVMGRFEAAHPDTTSVAVVDGALAGSDPVSFTSFIGAAEESGGFNHGVDRARLVAKRLNQIRGVASAHGPPESAVFVVLLLVDPMTLDLPPGAASLHGRYPELPGAVRIDVREIADDDIASYAAGLEIELRTRTASQQ